MTPYELTQWTDEKRHVYRAANALRQSFKRGRIPKPDSERLVTLKGGAIVWRYHWDITVDFLKCQQIFTSLTNLTKANYNDAKHGRRYILDIYQDGTTIDYIVKPGQPTTSWRGKQRNRKAMI